MTDFARYTVEKLSGLGVLRPGRRPGGGDHARSGCAELHRRHGFATSLGHPGAAARRRTSARALHPLLRPARCSAACTRPTDGLAAAPSAPSRRRPRAGRRPRRPRSLGRPPGHRRPQPSDGAGHRRSAPTEARSRADVVGQLRRLLGPADRRAGRPARSRCCRWPTSTPAPARSPRWPGPRRGERADPAPPGPRPVLPRARRPARHRLLRRTGPMPVDVRRRSPRGDAERARLHPRRLRPVLGRRGRAAARPRRGAAVDSGFNGVFSFTPDGFPLLGEHRELRGFWVAEAVWVTHSAGVARALAEWLVDGRPGVDLHECDLNRFDAAAARPGLRARRAARGTSSRCTTSSTRSTRRAARARCGSARSTRARSSWARSSARAPAGSGRSGTRRTPGCPRSPGSPARDEWSARHWSPIAAAEAQATRERVALYDMTPLTRLDGHRPGALVPVSG